MTERTTVRLPLDLLRRARRKAAKERRTLTSLIEEGLRLAIADNPKTKKSAARDAARQHRNRRTASGVNVADYSGQFRSWRTLNMSNGCSGSNDFA